MSRRSFLLLAALLVLLRLAIGWHFYIEGARKVESRRAGESLINKPFSSAGYLRGSTGPFADTFRALGDDPDREALARLDAGEPDADMEAGRKPWSPLLPPALKTHYDDYFERFVEHLDLGDERVTVEYRVDVPLAGEVLMKDEVASNTGQLDLAKARLAQAKEKAARWLLSDAPADAKKVEVAGVFKTGPVFLERTPKQRIADYRNKVAEIRDIEKHELTAFGRPVRKDLPALERGAARMRTELMADLDDILVERLTSILTDKQKKKLAADPVPLETGPSARLKALDDVLSYSLLVIGICLVLGVLTRITCVAGALFLLSTYLALPPLLGVPEAPKSEGFYYLVNKNLIELLALLALATTPSGRWLGLDSLLYCLNPFRKRQRPGPPARPVAEREPPGSARVDRPNGASVAPSSGEKVVVK